MAGRRRVAWLVVLLGGLASGACGLRDALTADVTVVARAGAHTLGVEELADMLAAGENLPLRRDIVERFAHRWVEYSLFAQRVAAGDSLLDSATVLATLWPDVHQVLVDEFHARLVEQRVRVDAATLDSAYAVGDLRAVQHILIRTRDDMSVAEWEASRRRAETARRRLEGGWSWSRANREYNEDELARLHDGTMGVVSRGELLPELEEVAFRLAPGEVSEVIREEDGFRIVRRAPLDEVRDAYRRALDRVLIERMDSTYLAELEGRWEIAVGRSAPAIIREAAEAPLVMLKSGRVIGTFRGGRFTVADLIRWLQVLPPEMHQQIFAAGDEQLIQFARSLIRNAVLALEAGRAGVTLSAEEYALLRRRHAGNLAKVRDRLAIDSVLGETVTGDEPLRGLDRSVKAYVRRLAGMSRDVAVVPPFLARLLKNDARWAVSAAGIDRVLYLATARREALGDQGASTGDQEPRSDQ